MTGNLSPTANATVRPFAQEDGSVSIAGETFSKGMWLFDRLAPKAAVVAAKAGGKPSLFPNDFCFGPDGAIYLTNTVVTFDDFAPNTQILPKYLGVHYLGRLYRNDPDTGVVEKTDRGIRLTNGIAVYSDELIRLNETLTGNIYRYCWDDGKVSAPCVLFGNVIQADATSGREGPGLMVSDQCGPSHVAVFWAWRCNGVRKEEGVVNRIAAQGKLPINTAVARPGKLQSHVTEYKHGQMETLGVDREGFPLCDCRKRKLRRVSE